MYGKSRKRRSEQTFEKSNDLTQVSNEL